MTRDVEKCGGNTLRQRTKDREDTNTDSDHFTFDTSIGRGKKMDRNDIFSMSRTE
jgi:hypothetical protein